MNSTPFLHPNQLLPANHHEILGELQKACIRFNETMTPKRALHIRDFWFFVEDGQSLVDIFVEPYPGHTGTSPFPPPEDGVTLDECLPLHQFLLEDGCLNSFDDEVGVRVGSLGVEPPLRTLAHFQASIGQLVTLKTWTKRQGRDRFNMFLDDVTTSESSPALRLKDGSDLLELPLSAVKFAQALLSQPKSAKANAPKAPKGPKRAREKV
jgi:ribosome maturation factor RimP